MHRTRNFISYSLSYFRLSLILSYSHLSALPLLFLPFPSSFLPYFPPSLFSSSISFSIVSGKRRCDLNLLTAHSAVLPSNPLLYASIYLHDLRANLRIVVTGTIMRASGTCFNKSA